MNDGQDWEQVVWKKDNTTTNIINNNINNIKEPAQRVMTVTLQNAIKQGRLNIKMSQKELAQKLNVDISIIIDYENGKAIPNNAFISRIEKALNTTLPRAPKKEKILNDN
jgi:ribosome-binding protein aMBF1 (putative translation factor)